MNGFNQTKIIQDHSGSGDNVGSKYYQVFQTLTPEHLSKQVGMVFSSIREKDNTKAAIQLEIIQSSDNLDDRARTVLQILSVHLGLTQSSSSNEAYSSLNKFLNSAKADIEMDICLAALLRLDLKNGRPEDAVERYALSPFLGEYTKEVFFELIADSDTLEAAFDTHKLSMTEGELNGVFRGAVRTDNYSLLKKVATRLDISFPSYNSQVFNLLCDALALNPTLLDTQSFYTTKSIKDKIDSILARTDDLIKKSRGADNRLFSVAASLLTYIGWEHQELEHTCWTFVSELEKSHPEYASILHIKYNANFDAAPIEVQKIAEVKNNFHTRLAAAASLINTKNITISDIPLFLETLSPSEIREWLNSGGTLRISDKLEHDFVEILIISRALSDEKNRMAIEALRQKTASFIDAHTNELKFITPALQQSFYIKPVFIMLQYTQPRAARTRFMAITLARHIYTVSTRVPSTLNIRRHARKPEC
jgi:hypothetical protein